MPTLTMRLRRLSSLSCDNIDVHATYTNTITAPPTQLNYCINSGDLNKKYELCERARVCVCVSGREKRFSHISWLPHKGKNDYASLRFASEICCTWCIIRPRWRSGIRVGFWSSEEKPLLMYSCTSERGRGTTTRFCAIIMKMSTRRWWGKCHTPNRKPVL